MSRRGLVALIVGPTLLVGVGIAVLLLLDVRAVQGDVDRADAAAADYATRLGEFRDDVAARAEDLDVDDPREVAELAEGLDDALPRLADAPERGVEGSAEYRAARDLRQTATEDVAGLQEVVEQALEVRAFVLAANDALDLDPQVLLPGGSFADGGPVRDRLLPPLRQALQDFRQEEVPEDGEEAATAVVTALERVLEEGETLAAELDAGRGYRFEYGEQYGAADAAVQGLASNARADLREAVDRVAGRGLAS